MKALVLAGGVGARLRPISYAIPKQLVPVANKPVLSYALEALRDAGITEVGLVVAGAATELRHHVGDGGSFRLHVSYITQDQPLGLAHCVLIAADFLGQDDFVMYLGDNVVCDGLAPVLDAYRYQRPDALIALGRVPDPIGYGVAELSPSGRITAVQEKPPTPRSDLAVIGVYVFSPAIHEAIRSIEPSWRNELEITDAVQWLVEQGGDVRGHVLHGYWKDTGRVEDLLDCNRVLMSALRTDIRGKVDDESRLIGPVVVEEGADVRHSRLVGPAMVGASSDIHDSYIGPFTTIGPDCRIYDVGVEHSIILAGASVHRIHDIRDSVIGREADVRPVPGRRHQLIVADHSRVLIGR